MYYLPWWMQWAQAIALIVISCLGSWIAYKQVRIAAAKLNSDLYDRRFKVFEVAREMLEKYRRNFTITFEDVEEMTVGTADAVFLFGEDVQTYLRELQRNAYSYRAKSVQLSGMKTEDPEYAILSEKVCDLQDAVLDVNRLVSVFKPYLKLGNI
jgi:hypothetical protein